MRDPAELADRTAAVTASAPEILGRGFREYQRFRLALRSERGAAIEQVRDVLRGGKVAAVLPVDLARDEIVMIRQFRLPAHLANGKGDLVEIVAGRVEPGETPTAAAHRECSEEIGVAPTRLVELFSYLTSPGLTDEEVTVFLASVDAARVPAQTGGASPHDERIEICRVPIDAAVAALDGGTMRNGPLIIALQWLALNRGRLRALLASDGGVPR